MKNLDSQNDIKVTPFPDAKERKALEKERLLSARKKAPSEPVFNLPPVIKVICLVNIGIFLFMTLFPTFLSPEDLYALAYVPARYFNGQPLGFDALLSPLTHMFIHAGWLHVVINVGTLLAFGAGLEKKIGGRKLLLLYFTTGLLGAAFHTLIYPHMEEPMVGASGAVSGLFGAILIMMYEEGAMGQGYRKLLPFIVIWIGISIFFGFFGMPGVDNPIAWTTHIGGFISGLLLYKPIRRLKIQH